MRIDCITTFPDMYASVMGASMMKRAQEKGILQFQARGRRASIARRMTILTAEDAVW